jgi:anti-sigma factor RsiW
MTCAELRPFLDAYVDGTLDLALHLEIERHVNSCETCATAVQSRRQLGSLIRAHAPYYKASKKLHARIRAQVRPTPVRSWLLVAACVIVAVLLGWGTVRAMRWSADDRLVDQVVASHVRSLMAGHLTDVASTDQHTVKPWFAGKLNFSPAVGDFSAQGFPLLGGRLDYLDGRPAAALIYGRRLHRINLFVWPGRGGDSRPSSLTQRGFHVVHWEQGGLQYWAVSDAALSDLEQFAQLVREFR